MYKGLNDTTQGLRGRDRFDVGYMTASLLLTGPAWAHRRVETISPADEDTVKRTVSVDFSLPYWFHVQRLAETDRQRLDSKSVRRELGRRRRHLVPLAWLKKGLLVNFSLRDDEGHAVPLLNFEQNVQVACAVLEFAAEAALGEPPEPGLVADFRRVAGCAHGEWETLQKDLFGRNDAAHAQREALGASSVFRGLASNFASSLLALGIVQLACHERRIVYFEYDQLATFRGSSWRVSRGPVKEFLGAVRDGLCGRGRLLPVVLNDVNFAASTHVEFVAPSGLEIETFAVIEADDDGDAFLLTSEGEHSAGRVHVHVPRATTRDPLFIAAVRPRSTAVARGAALVGVLVVLGLFWFALKFDAIRHEVEAVVAILLSFSALLTLFVVQADRNGMASKVLFPTRLLGIAPGAVAVAVAAYLTTVACPSAPSACTHVSARWMWVALALAFASVVLLGVAWGRSVKSRASVLSPKKV